MEEEKQVQEERIDPISFFSPEIQQPVTGLIYLGAHSDVVKFCGHTIGLQTLRPHVKFAIGQAMEPFRNTMAQPLAWEAMHVGAALTSIDGKKDFCPPIGDNLVEFVLGRLEYVTGESGWWPPTISFFFAKYIEMENLVLKALDELQSLSEAGKPLFSRSPGSLTEQEPSLDPTSLVNHFSAPSN